MKNTKERVFDQILLLRKATIAQLSEKIGLSEISIRHHLMSMEAEGIVASAEERHGVGRPRFVYFLTEKGFKNAPTNYLKLSDQALTTMKGFLDADSLLALLTQIGRDLAINYASSLGTEDHDQSLDLLTNLLAKDGFIFSWIRSGEKYTLTTHHCPFQYLGQNHPEICTIIHALLESLIQSPISHDTCVLRGDAACTYTYEVQNGK
ncbi:MAG TPA: helix-turn-helix transcriptional regulator [Anaerolineaceae bacterium]|nr:helix-turn-helix transcriptional regulator [Anaerolineaceae bacterium]